MKKYSVKEIFLTLQGEGFNTGKTAIFCRFTGCNLWNGKSKDKKKAICNFCDTDFVGTNGINGGKYLLNELVNQIKTLWPAKKKKKAVKKKPKKKKKVVKKKTKKKKKIAKKKRVVKKKKAAKKKKAKKKRRRKK